MNMNLAAPKSRVRHEALNKKLWGSRKNALDIWIIFSVIFGDHLSK
jgi:hypothetical protein